MATAPPAGASRIPVEQVRKGMTVVVKGRACRVGRTTTLSMGMHGVRKTIVSGEDALTGRKLEDIVAGGDVEVAVVAETRFGLAGADARTATLAGRGPAPFASDAVAAQAAELLAGPNKAGAQAVVASACGAEAVVAVGVAGA